MIDVFDYEKYCPSCGLNLTWELSNARPWAGKYDSETGDRLVRVILYCRNYDDLSLWQKAFGPVHHKRLGYGMSPVVEDMPLKQFKKLKKQRRIK